MSDTQKHKGDILFEKIAAIIDEYSREKHQPWWVQLAEALDCYEKSQERKASVPMVKEPLSYSLLEESQVMPLNGYAMKAHEQARNRVRENTPLMVRIGKWFGRREKTLWTIAELQALISIRFIEGEDLSVMEEYYTADIPTKENIRRRDLITMLNNWNGELDRAKGWATKQKPNSGSGQSRFHHQSGSNVAANW